MTFDEYLDSHRNEMMNYIFDAPYDHIADLLRSIPVQRYGNHAITNINGQIYMNIRTHQLLYVLHKLNIRPTL